MSFASSVRGSPSCGAGHGTARLPSSMPPATATTTTRSFSRPSCGADCLGLGSGVELSAARESERRPAPRRVLLCMESGTPPRDTAWAMSEENVELGKDAFNRWNAGARTFGDEIHPDVEILSRGLMEGRLLRGREGVRRWFREVDEQF